MPRSMDESSSSAPTPEPFERKVTRSLLGAAVGLGSSIGTAGMALGPIWGGSLFAYSSDPDAGLGILGNGRLLFATLSLLAILNSRLASRLPPWPREAGQDWRYEFFRCRRTSLQRLPAPCGAVA